MVTMMNIYVMRQSAYITQLLNILVTLKELLITASFREKHIIRKHSQN